MERLILGDRCMVAACREGRKARRHDAAVRAFVTKPLRGIFCGLARDLPPASGEGITSHNSRWGIGRNEVERTALAGGLRLRSAARSGGPVPHRSYADVIASRSRDRPQS